MKMSQYKEIMMKNDRHSRNLSKHKMRLIIGGDSIIDKLVPGAGSPRHPLMELDRTGRYV
jgi:hypothetical protein